MSNFIHVLVILLIGVGGGIIGHMTRKPPTTDKIDFESFGVSFEYRSRGNCAILTGKFGEERPLIILNCGVK